MLEDDREGELKALRGELAALRARLQILEKKGQAASGTRRAVTRLAQRVAEGERRAGQLRMSRKITPMQEPSEELEKLRDRFHELRIELKILQEKNQPTADAEAALAAIQRRIFDHKQRQ